MQNVLVLCSQCPYPPSDGAKLRLYNTAKILSRRYSVDLLIVQNEADEDALSYLRTEFNRVVPFSHSKVQFYGNVAKGALSRQPVRANYYTFADVNRWLDEHQDTYDLVFANYLNTTEYVRERDVTKVVDLVDAMSENYLQRAGEANDENYLKRQLYRMEGRQLRRYERTVIQSFDHSFVTTAVDARTMTETRSDSKLTVVPNGVREEFLSRPLDENHDSSKNPCLVFLGRMDYFPNEDAVRYFVSEVFPSVRDRHPEAEFFIVGSHPSERVRELGSRPNVTVTGFVTSPVEYLSKADVVVAPMRFGTGIQNKVLEAMALGKSVVTTPLGTEGIDGDDDTHFVVAEDAPGFIDAVSSLLDSPEERTDLGRNARALVEKQYSWDEISSVLLDTVEEVLADNPDSGNRI